MRTLMLFGLLLMWPVVVQAQDDQPRPPLVIRIPPELLNQVELSQQPQTAETKAERQADLTMPEMAFIASAAADWATSFGACTPSCTTRELTVPDVSQKGLAIPLGLAIDAATIWVLTEYVAPKWPHAAQGLLYVFSIMRSLEAEKHVETSESRARGLP